MIMKCSTLHVQPYTEYCDRRHLSVAKNGSRKYELQNISNNRICKFHIDGGYITEDDVQKCDYGFLLCEKEHLILVELKGRHFSDALDQIFSTIVHKQHEIKDFILSARIVLTKVRVPDIQNYPKYLKLKKRIEKVGGTIKYNSGKLIDKF